MRQDKICNRIIINIAVSEEFQFGKISFITYDLGGHDTGNYRDNYNYLEWGERGG